MYQPSSLASGAKWLFSLVIILIGIVFALGFNLRDAKWLNGKIASATAEQMSLATDIERQKAELNLQVLKNQTELQITREKQQAEYEAAQQQQQLDALFVANTQKAQFRNGLYNAINVGLMTLMIAISVVLAVCGINLSFGLRKVATIKAPVATLLRSSTTNVRRLSRQPSLAAQQARQREMQEREKQIWAKRNSLLFKNSRPIWSANDGKNDELIPGNHPWIG